MPIKIKGVTHIYKKGTPFEKKALEDIFLNIENGEILGIMGKSGSGKSTFLQLLNGLLRPCRGKIIVDDYDITMIPADEIAAVRREVGLVFQFPEEQIFETDVYKEIAFGPKNLGIDEKKTFERVKTAMKLTGLEYVKFKDRRPNELSGGEKRRVGIADILALNPRYLLLDEPFAALDYEGRRKIYQSIKELNQTRGTTTIIVSHNLEYLVPVCNRLLILADGRVKLDIKIDEIALYIKEIKNLGVSPPLHHEVLYYLKEKGFNINVKVRTREEAAREIAKYLGTLKDEVKSG
ncbi:ATP-binding cassette domain-containing protein [Thermosyntropha sp.]|uniref:ATP-binding cassette domain-containing protein n=1 Tax=Thermosyntropha sp. TaxID=2740820 RepID=UPI0025E72FF7|nr:ATP-binding cassette domain-containing protein [Thermosyntropha sp.]MBO8158071.1 energy-coupling factor transporter ATPase [Thermosyntropha sp.]